MVARAFLAATAVLALVLTGCAVSTQMLADSDDLADYRAYRVAAHPGARLARAESYLAAHPSGAWTTEVRAFFAAEEPRYYEAAQASRKAALEYLLYLPRGPHAEAAQALVDSFDQSMRQAEIDRLVREMRRRAALRRQEAERRAKVRDAILEDVSLLLSARAYGVPLAELPEALRRALSGGRVPTIGSIPRHVERTLFYTVPSREGGEDRALTLQLALDVDDGVVVEGRIRGIGLFAAWTEADLARAAADRGEVRDHVAALLGGALEPRLPESRCAAPAARGDLQTVLYRRCDGWSALAKAGASPSDIDEIVIRGVHAGP
jgi:hypothetical protein